MASWFARRAATAPAAEAEPVGAYREGRRDEQRRVQVDHDDDRASPRQLEEAYKRGRREERLRRQRHPIGMLMLTLLALIGVAAIVGPIRYGSFTAAGAAADGIVASTTQQASAPVRGAADRAGNALQNAGGAIKSTAGTPSSTPSS